MTLLAVFSWVQKGSDFIRYWWVTLRILWQINNYNFRFNFEILHSFLFSNASNTFRNTQFLSLESKITMNRHLTLVLRVKNMRRRISPIMKVIIWSFSKSIFQHIKTKIWLENDAIWTTTQYSVNVTRYFHRFEWWSTLKMSWRLSHSWIHSKQKRNSALTSIGWKAKIPLNSWSLNTWHWFSSWIGSDKVCGRSNPFNGWHHKSVWFWFDTDTRHSEFDEADSFYHWFEDVFFNLSLSFLSRESIFGLNISRRSDMWFLIYQKLLCHVGSIDEINNYLSYLTTSSR